MPSRPVGGTQLGNPVSVIDIVEDAIWRETDGVVTEIIRKAMISGIVATGYDEALKQALLLSPQPGASHPILPQLIVRDRTPKALSPRIVEVLVTYQLPEAGSLTPPGEDFRLSGGSSVEQISTQLDANGNQITVTHQGVTQGGEITPLVARSEIVLERVEGSSAPLAISRFWTNTVNNGGWFLDLLASPRTWLVADVSFRLVSMQTSPPKWQFTYVMRHDPDGYDPQVVYIDPETGRPPAGLVAGQGYKTIPWHVAVDFNQLI